MAMGTWLYQLEVLNLHGMHQGEHTHHVLSEHILCCSGQWGFLPHIGTCRCLFCWGSWCSEPCHWQPFSLDLEALHHPLSTGLVLACWIRVRHLFRHTKHVYAACTSEIAASATQEHSPTTHHPKNIGIPGYNELSLLQPYHAMCELLRKVKEQAEK